MRTDNDISPTDVNYHSDEDDDMELDSVVADLMDHDGFIDIGAEGDRLVEDAGDDGDIADLTDAFDMADFFKGFEANIEWGGYEYDHVVDEDGVEGDVDDNYSIDVEDNEGDENGSG